MSKLGGNLISIIVPNYNGAKYLQQCLDSILRQGYLNNDAVLMDGGSTDRSLEIARSYDDRIAVISERDNGQSDAINKGIARCGGEIIGYLNSDDVLEPDCLDRVCRYFVENPDAEWLVGGCRVFGEDTEEWVLQPEGWNRLLDTVLPWSRPQRYVFPQSGACFMRRRLVERLGPYDTGLHYSMDMEYYARAAFSGAVMRVVPEILAGWRIHRDSKSWTRGCAYAFRKDECAILERYLPRLTPSERAIAEEALRKELPNLLLREGNYWSAEGQRGRGLAILLRLALHSPNWIFRRPWLGGVRRSIVGFGA